MPIFRVLTDAVMQPSSDIVGANSLQFPLSPDFCKPVQKFATTGTTISLGVECPGLLQTAQGESARLKPLHENRFLNRYPGSIPGGGASSSARLRRRGDVGAFVADEQVSGSAETGAPITSRFHVGHRVEPHRLR